MMLSTSASSPPTIPTSSRYPGFGPAVLVARRQGGVITYRQALAVGLTRGQLRQLVHTGQWSHPVRGAFVVAGPVDLAAVGEPAPRRAEQGADDGNSEPKEESPDPLSDNVGRHRQHRSGSFPRNTTGTSVWVSGAAGGGSTLATESPLWPRVRAALLGRPHAVVCGITAARLQGFRTVGPQSPDEPVHLLLPARLTRAQPRGVRLHFSDLAAEHRAELRGLPIVAPARTLADLVLAAPTRESAVAAMDAALRGRLVPRLDEAREAAAGRRGFRPTVDWWSQADGRAESELETRLRLLLIENGLTPPELQWPVTDGTGQLVARLDLAWPAHRVDVEADPGPAASSPSAVYLDRHRGNILAALRWAVLRFTASDVTRHPDRVISAVTRVLAVRTAEASEGLRAS